MVNTGCKCPTVFSQIKEENKISTSNISIPPTENHHSVVLSIHDAIKPLYCLSRIFSLWPYKYNIDNKLISLNMKDKIIAHVFLAFITIYPSWSIYTRNKTLYKSQPMVSSIIDGIFNFYLHLLAASSIILANTSRTESTKQFYMKLDHIVKSSPLFQNCIFNDIHSKILTQIWITLILGFLVMAVQLCLGFVVNYMLVIFYISSFICEGFLFLIVLQIMCKVEVLTKYFEVLNYRLRGFHEKISTICVFSKERTDEAKYIQELCKIHQQLCNLIVITNETHGGQIVLLSCTIISLSINSLYYGIVNGITAGSDVTREVTFIERAFTCQAIFNVAFHSGLLIVLSIKCSWTRKAALKAGTLANQMLADIATDASNECKRAYKEQLQFLIQHINFENPQFSAAGIFPVDSSMISIIAGAVATYFIVILQFKQPKSE